MKNIRIIDTKININKVIEQLKKNPQDWDHQKNIENIQSLTDH